jgi:uncharacterized protein
MKIVCYYHSADLDGICSAAIVNKHFKDDHDVELIGIDHGMPIRDEDLKDADQVFFVDYCPPMARLKELAPLPAKEAFTVIDHHKSVIDAKDRPDQIEFYLDNDFSGCELTWKFFYPDKEIPDAVKLLGRYDVWDHKDQDTLPFQAGAKMHLTTPRARQWKGLLGDDRLLERAIIKKLLEDGEVLEQGKEQADNKKCKTMMFTSDLEVDKRTYSCLCVNSSEFNSLSFDGHPLVDSVDILLPFYLRKDGIWCVSFYTRKKDIDCSVIAKSFGGGGHKQASGCQVDYKTLKTIISKLS